jgi:hypothetical protein
MAQLSEDGRASRKRIRFEKTSTLLETGALTNTDCVTDECAVACSFVEDREEENTNIDEGRAEPRPTMLKSQRSHIEAAYGVPMAKPY